MRTAVALLTIATVLWALPAHAQSAPTGRAIGLPEAIALAVKQNRTIASGDADVEIPVSNEITGSGIEDFEIDGKGSWTRQRSSFVTGSQFQQTALDNVHTELSFLQPLFYGGRIGLRLSNDFTKTTSAFDLGSGPMDNTVDTWQPVVQLLYTQPLLRGFGESIFPAPKRRTAAATDTATPTLERTRTHVV